VRANKARDKRKEDAIRALGFSIEVIWQCELRDMDRLTQKIKRLVRPGER
jgi:G:T-mismatch repair DNA endonuclease (very short patch repair protein)